MKKINIHKLAGLGLLVAAMFFQSCEDFLDRPTEDSFTVGDYFKNDDQCIAAVNTLYASPWNDYLRGIYNIGDKLSGNWMAGDKDVFYTMSFNASQADLADASNALWLVISHCNTAMEYISKAEGSVSQTVKNQCLGEAMVIKSMAYFYLVRSWGSVPIIHSTKDVVETGSSFELRRYREQDVYDYIINTLLRAMELLPKTSGTEGRVDYYSAEGLLAKVYLQAAASKDGSLNAAILEKAKEHAQNVIEQSGRVLMENYEDIFRMSTGKKCQEGLITLQWAVSASRWTINNWSQPDFVASIFGGTGNGWGEWGGPSLELQQLFDVDVTNPASIKATAYAYVDDPNAIKDNYDKEKDAAAFSVSKQGNVDVRRQVTMSMYGDYYWNWWRDKEGFVNNCDNDYNTCNRFAGPDATTSVFSSPTGAQAGMKTVYGNSADHIAENGVPSSGMCGAMPTHLLRLSDVYLVYVEACMPAASDAASRSTSDATALQYYNAVRKRAHATETEGTVTFDELMNERRRELAYEGDTWFDFVRQGDYDLSGAKAKLLAQERGYYSADELKGIYGIDEKKYTATSTTLRSFKLTQVIKGANNKELRLPFPQSDVVANPNLGSDYQPDTYDFGSVDYYKADNFANL
ncbi:MAG: RagB/SusD family nutrient uptake outer membrane protein [Bacteroidales bacterium]|nr:RagB/SusD family nutrient uptake outer membrane protein [Bacteroidales bacterium]